MTYSMDTGMNELVSVIVPVYNSAYYLKACCESIQKQTFKNLQIIFVDDGSTDRSRAIIERKAQKDKRILLIRTQHQGVSEARNAGIRAAKGEYICFVDSDDLIPPDSIEVLYRGIQDNQSDYIQGSIMGLHFFHTRPYIKNKDKTITSDDQEELRLLLIDLNWGPVAALFKKSIIDKHLISFIPEIKLGEDAIFLAAYLRHCKRISTCGRPVYYYNRMNTNSATRSRYEDTWKWFIRFTEMYSHLFNDDYVNKPYAVEEIAIRNLNYTFRNYVIYSDGIGKEKTVELLHTAYTHYAVYLNGLDAEGVKIKGSLRFIEKYKDLLLRSDFEAVYQDISKNKPADKNQLKKIIKNCCLAFRKVLIFRVKVLNELVLK